MICRCPSSLHLPVSSLLRPGMQMVTERRGSQVRRLRMLLGIAGNDDDNIDAARIEDDYDENHVDDAFF